MQKRQAESYGRRDDSGKFKSIFKDKNSLKLFKCSEGEHAIDILPFFVGKMDPYTKEGSMNYLLDIRVHNKIGPNEDSYVCMQTSFKADDPRRQACPICEYRAELLAEGEDEKAKAFSASRRAIYNVWCHNSTREEDKGIQIWDVSHFLFEKELTENSRLKKGGGYVYFSDIEDGRVVSFRRVGNGATTTKYTAFTFEKREEDLPDEILDQCKTLDELIYWPSYEEIAAVLKGTVKSSRKEEDEEDETPSWRKKREEPEEEEAPPRRKAREEKEEEDTPPPRWLKKEEAEEEAPTRRKVKGEDEEKLVQEKSSAKKEDVTDANQCPYNHDFGIDRDNYDDCDDCTSRKACRTEKKTLAMKEEKEEEVVEEKPPVRRRR